MPYRPSSLLAAAVAVALSAPLAVAAVAAAEPGFAELAAALETPRVGAAVHLAGPIQVGRATITLGGGTAVRRLLAGDQAVGLLVDGPAELRYRVEESISVPVARRNLKRASSLRVATAGGGLEVTEPLRGAVIWNRTVAAAATGGDEAAEAGSLPAWATEILANLLTSGRSSSWMLTDFGSGRAAADAVTYALLHGEHEDLRLVVDTVLEKSESLDVIAKLPTDAPREFRGSRVVYDLVDQPIGRRWWNRVPAPLMAVHESIAVDNTGGRDATITTRTRVQAMAAGWSVWRVGLADSLWDGKDLLPVSVRSVEVDGKPAAWVHWNDELLIDLGRALAADQTAEVKVVHQGPFAYRPSNDNYWYLTTWAWYPQPSLAAERASLEMEVRVPEPFVAFASGDTVSRSRENGQNVLRTKTDTPVQYPVVVAGKYHTFEAEGEGMHAEVASYVFAKEGAAKVIANLVFGAASVYRQLFGAPYPFAEIDVVEINSWGFGQAPPGLIFITAEAYSPIKDEINRLFSEGVNGRLLHEVAHTWWGELIKMDSLEEQWLTESFAEYSAAVALQAMTGGKRGDRELDLALHGWKGRATQIGEGGSIYLANYFAGDGEADARDRNYLLYAKGPLVLHALRQELGRKLGGAEAGDKAFFTLLRSFVTNFKGRYGETRHLVGILNQMTGSDWQPWFEKYVYGTEMPPVSM